MCDGCGAWDPPELYTYGSRRVPTPVRGFNGVSLVAQGNGDARTFSGARGTTREGDRIFSTRNKGSEPPRLCFVTWQLKVQDKPERAIYSMIKGIFVTLFLDFKKCTSQLGAIPNTIYMQHNINHGL